MRHFTKLLLFCALLFSAVATFGQSADSTQAPATPETTVPAPAPTVSSPSDSVTPSKPASESTSHSSQLTVHSSDSTKIMSGAPPDSSIKKSDIAAADAGGDTSKAAQRKDRQNQVQFFKQDMESKNYNFYQRKDISQPLMPPYDLDSAVYQKGKKKEKQQQKTKAIL